MYRFNINPVEKNSQYVNLQSRYKDYKYIKNIIKSRRIDLRDNSDITETELYPENNELNNSD